jgi:hypothetical protein
MGRPLVADSDGIQGSVDRNSGRQICPIIGHDFPLNSVTIAQKICTAVGRIGFKMGATHKSLAPCD